MSDRIPDHLLGRWIHSREEDGATERVYRRPDFAFPPARGRSGFELGTGGRLIDVGIAPGDGALETAGSWSLDGARLQLDRPGSTRVLEIVSVEPERLVVKPE